MADNSDRQPDQGYLLPTMSAGYLPRPDTARPYLAVLDGALEDVRVAIDALHDAHVIAHATDEDLDELAALVGLERLPSETDDQLRARIPATVQHGISASAGPDMVAYLSAATGLPATVTDWPSGGGFDVEVVGSNGLLGALPDLVRKAKALGICFRAYAVVGSAGGSGGVAEFGLGEQGLGGGDARLFLGS